MNTDEKKLSKLYRKMVTVDGIRAILLYKTLDIDTKEEVRKMCRENGSYTAQNLLTQLEKI